MCGRYGLVPPQDFFTRFEIENADFSLTPNTNASPGQLLPVITMNSPKKLQAMKWGLIPHWAKDPKIGYKMINARAEGIEEKPSFRSSFKNRRCLIPATCFYEWQKDSKNKTQYLIKLKDRETFAFAGLYDIWQDTTRTFTIITTTPNEEISKIHDRMPVILSQEDEDLWADNSLFNAQNLLSLLKPFQSGQLVTTIFTV